MITLTTITSVLIILTLFGAIFIMVMAYMHDMFCTDCPYKHECEQNKDNTRFVQPCRHGQTHQANCNPGGTPM